MNHIPTPDCQDGVVRYKFDQQVVLRNPYSAFEL